MFSLKSLSQSNRFKNFTFALLCCSFMTGCASVREDFESAFLKKEEGGEEVYVYNAEPEIGMTYPDMAREMSSGDVHLYPMDGGPSAPAAPGAMGERGIPSSRDPNVTTYSLSDSMEPRELPPGHYAGMTTPPAAPPEPGEERDTDRFAGGARMTAPPVPGEDGDRVFLSPSPGAQGQAPMHAIPAHVTGPRNTSKIYFPHGSARIDKDGHEVIGYVSEAGRGTVTVDGHASSRAAAKDQIERRIKNLKMSMNRAFAVSSELMRKGVPLEAIETRAFGDAQPAAPIPGVDPEAASRRVEIHSAQPAYVNAPPAPGGSPYQQQKSSPVMGASQPAPAPQAATQGNTADDEAEIPPLVRY